MVKRSRRRHPLLPPLALPLHSIRFVLSHTMRMEGRARQIQRSASMVNVTKLEGRPSQQQPHHSPVTPRRSSQTLTSSKVESASMSEKCEIRFDAQQIGLVPFQDASGGPGDVADRNVVDSLEAKVNTAQASKFEATHRGSSTPPPLDFFDYPDEFKSLGTDRLLPCDLNNPCVLQQYKAYLDWFYYFHKGPGPVACVADAAFQCLEKENSMRFWWRTMKGFSYVSESLVSECIVDCMLSEVKKGGESELPFGVDAAACIAKEAELIIEWLRRRGPLLNNEEFYLCHDIRVAAHKLFIFQGKWSIDIAAALLGIRKEAEWLLENLRLGSIESVSTSMKIRRSALDFVWQMFPGYEPYMSEGSSEMASESDDDVTVIEENTTWG
ncbi:hypothetical protein E2562_007451 [Oryza meyeriana var. granulata]|uniref:Uncharacterized protein n=1 Tax=Oryza meyeriana var. granulata TaxID=110450 RepID=A0A6G1F4X3_9ORYZ|nr:hypothetical protein E2562_007451 [Oryza meyeriana var. granulata]KAF0931950.1 hypothetical protein E2562_007451 [Oryza meyeriana var. granulata]